MVAEDDPATRMLLYNVLTDEKFRVIVVSDGEAALQTIREEQPDLILLDRLMPRKDGAAVLRDLRSDPGSRHIPVIVLTSVSDVGERVDALAAGAQDYLIKPFAPHELIARIEQQLRWLKAVEGDSQAHFDAERNELRYISEQRCSVLADSHPQMVWLADRRGIINYRNPAWFAYTGVAADHKQADVWRSILHPDDAGGFFAAWRACVEAESPMDMPLRIRRAADGLYHVHRVSANPVRGRDGRLVEWIGTCHDLEIEREAEKSRSALDNIGAIVAIWDERGEAEYFNRLWTMYTGLPLELSLGGGWRHSIHPADAHGIAADVARYGDQQSSFEHEVRLRGIDGTYRWFRLRTALVEAAATPLERRWISVASDIDEAKQALEREQQLVHTLQRALSPKSLPSIANLTLSVANSWVTAEADVGGDWFDVVELPDGSVFFSVGDIGGHGIEAAVTMSCARQSVLANALYERDPAAIFARVNELFHLQKMTIGTSVCGFIDMRAMTLRYSTAGHPAPILAEPGRQPRFLPYDGMPLGVLPDAPYASFEQAVVPGSLLVLCTDGVLENRRDIIEGERRLLEATGAVFHADPRSRAELIHAMTFASVPPIDDAAVITISFHGDPPNSPGPPPVGSIEDGTVAVWEAGGGEAKSAIRGSAGD